jgi:phosphoglycolate phosphatase-like HAD superfamily hydrolase
MRISFDMDGVLADMDSALARIAEAEFGITPRAVHQAPGSGPQAPAGVRLQRPESSGSVETSPESPEPSPPLVTPYPATATLEQLSARQQTRLWQRVTEVRNFWETLSEHEPGTVRRLQDLAYQLRWEVLFVTQRPSTAGRTAQVQTQRWLHKHGFDLPAVYTTKGSRGHIASALTLDAHVDDRLENAVDIASDSRAWSILVWRDDASFERIQINGRKMKIAVVRTVNEAIDQLVEADQATSGGESGAPGDAAHPGSALLGRLKKTFGMNP